MASFLARLLFLDKILVGLRAFVVQSYTEANVKNGLQYEFSGDTPVFAAGAANRLIFITGAKPVIIKSRVLSFTATKVTATVYRSPTYTGGTPQTPFNLNDINPVTSTVTVITGATVTNNGTQFGAVNYLYGTSGVGNSQSGTFVSPGIERVLQPNTTYMLETVNSGEGTHSISAYLTWYEGIPDLPRAEQEL